MADKQCYFVSKYHSLLVNISSEVAYMLQDGSRYITESPKYARFRKGLFRTKDQKLIDQMIEHPSYNKDFHGPFDDEMIDVKNLPSSEATVISSPEEQEAEKKRVEGLLGKNKINPEELLKKARAASTKVSEGASTTISSQPETTKKKSTAQATGIKVPQNVIKARVEKDLDKSLPGIIPSE